MISLCKIDMQIEWSEDGTKGSYHAYAQSFIKYIIEYSILFDV